MNDIIEQLKEEIADFDGYPGFYIQLLNYIEELQAKIDELEHKVYCWKVQESLMRPLIDDNFKA